MAVARTKDSSAIQILAAQRFMEFKAIGNSKNAQWYALERNANYSDSIRLLEEAGLRPITCKEALAKLMNDQELKNLLKDKSFYLIGKWDGRYGLHRICGDGTLVCGKGPSMEQTARIWVGMHPLRIDIYSDKKANLYGVRFSITSRVDTNYYIARIIVGVPKEQNVSKQEVSLRTLY
jgi:hypothetical protein